MRAVALVILVTESCTIITAEGTETLHTIDLERYPSAVCLDGSAGAFYFWPSGGVAKSRKWYVYLDGGGWCSMDVPNTQAITVDSCYHRATTNLGSSSSYPRNASEGWTIWGHLDPLSSDPAVNPLMYDWNKVALVYCDGGSFSGRNLTTAEIGGRRLYFRGGYIIQAIMETLLNEHGLADATDVVIGGYSAGGLASFLHADRWRDAIPASAFVAALPDSGFFVDWDASKPSLAAHTYAYELRANFWAFNASAGVHADCVRARLAVRGDVADCYFAEHTAPFLQTPTFALQSTVDSWQLLNEFGKSGLAHVDEVNQYRVRVIARLEEALLTGPTRGGFIDSCLHHCGQWTHIAAHDGMTAASAFAKWYTAQRAAWEAGVTPLAMAWWQAEKYPCNWCCGEAVQELLVL